METLLQSLERERYTDPLSEEVYQILHALEVRSASIPDVVPVHPSPNSPKGATCENCGLPSDAIASDGYAFSLETRPDNKFQHRSTKHKVWCCSRECGVQSLARNKYGEASHRWPVTLAEFRQLEGEPFFRRLDEARKPSDRYETPPHTIENTGPERALFGKVALAHVGRFRNASGRPKTYPTRAARQRAYRTRQRAASRLLVQSAGDGINVVRIHGGQQ